VEMLQIMSAMGFGIAYHKAQEIVDTIVNHDEPEVLHTPCSKHASLQCIFKRNSDLQTTSAVLLDPQRATLEVQDAMFEKLEVYIKVLKAANKVPWESYQKIPKDCTYNMDKVGTDTIQSTGQK
jgi:hypothetical protein